MIDGYTADFAAIEAVVAIVSHHEYAVFRHDDGGVRSVHGAIDIVFLQQVAIAVYVVVLKLDVVTR